MINLRMLFGRVIGEDIKNALKRLGWSARQVFRSYYQVTGDRRAVLAAAHELLFGPRRYLVFRPRAPYRETYILSKILNYLRVRPTTDLAKLSTGCPLVIFKDATCFNPRLPHDLPAGLRVINRTVTDIRKSRVEEVFSSVAGYSTFIDPLTYQGLAVEKSEQNSRHDGRVITCPLPAVREGCIYQRLIENVDDHGRAVDLRVPVIGGSIPLVYVKRRPLDRRFDNTNEITELCSPDALFAASELELLTRFAGRFGLDFGELDVLRDRIDGRLYIVDVNNTPAGPPNGLPQADATRAVQILADAFRTAFL